ncbi:hypothetical protein [Burkholderia phage FLC6]|nr:hypothetical protein [Burkholderia phage FLC6]
MTQKSASRRQKDAERRAAAGMTSGKKSFDREKTSRCWYQLKEVHQRSQKNINKLAELFAQYNHPVVLMKVAKNGEKEAFDAEIAKIQPLVAEMAKEFQALWDSHGHIRKLCLSYEELSKAYRIFEAYQAFDIDLFNKFQPIIGALNLIYNKALKELLEAQDALTVEQIEAARAAGQEVAILDEGDVPQAAKEVEAPAEGMEGISADGEDALKPSEIINQPAEGRGQSRVVTPVDELGVVETEEVTGQPQPGIDLIRI